MSLNSEEIDSALKDRDQKSGGHMKTGAYYQRCDLTNLPAGGMEALTPESTWILVDGRAKDLGHGPFPNRKAAINCGRSLGYIVYGMYPSQIVPGEEEDS